MFVASKKITEMIYYSAKYNQLEMNRVAKRIFDLVGLKYRQLHLNEALVEKLHEHFLPSVRSL